MWRRREKTGTALYDESGCNTDMTRRSPGCGSQRLLRYRSHPAGGGRRRCKWLDRYDDDRKPN